VGEIFRTCPDWPWGPLSLLYNGYRVFPGGKERPGRDADPSPPSSAVGHGRIELYLYPPPPPLDRTACTEPQCLYKCALYLFYLQHTPRMPRHRRTAVITAFVRSLMQYSSSHGSLWPVSVLHVISTCREPCRDILQAFRTSQQSEAFLLLGKMSPAVLNGLP
jgi:hypothetical protein